MIITDRHFKKLGAFTFIEMVIVVGIMGMAMPILFSIIFTILKEQVKLRNITQVKREGDYILNSISNNLRTNAVGIYSDQALTTPKCQKAQAIYGPQTDGSDFFFKTLKGNWLQFATASEKIELKSASGNSQISSDVVEIKNLELSCERKADSKAPLITIKFDVFSNSQSTRSEENAFISYQTRIKLRNIETSQIE